VKARRRAWQGREIVMDGESWPAIVDPVRSAHERLEENDLLDSLRDAIRSSLTPHQRNVFVALAFNGSSRVRTPTAGCPACVHICRGVPPVTRITRACATSCGCKRLRKRPAGADANWA
jgi:hypothetical protein